MGLNNALIVAAAAAGDAVALAVPLLQLVLGRRQSSVWIALPLAKGFWGDHVCAKCAGV